MKAIRRNARRQINAILDDAALIRYCYNGHDGDGVEYRAITAAEAREMMARVGVDSIWDSESGEVSINLDNDATIGVHATIDNVRATLTPEAIAKYLPEHAAA